MEAPKKIKSMSFHQYSRNSDVETTWISLIGSHHKTSNMYVLMNEDSTWKSRILIMPREAFRKVCKFPTFLVFTSWGNGRGTSRHILGISISLKKNRKEKSQLNILWERFMQNLLEKSGQQSAICWNSLGPVRDYGLNCIFLVIKLFCFSR